MMLFQLQLKYRFMDLTQKLYPALDKLISEIENKAESVKGIVKTGRTHLMDAMPVDSDGKSMVESVNRF